MEKEVAGSKYTKPLKILITGPECTGKTELCSQLSEQYDFVNVPEYAVEYLYEIDRPYNYDDLLLIAKHHNDIYLDLITSGCNFIMDTFLINLKIWSEYRYNKSEEWISRTLSNTQFDLVLLMEPDIPWERADFRENPDDRDVLFQKYLEELDRLGWNYHSISGHGGKRMLAATELIDACLQNKH